MRVEDARPDDPAARTRELVHVLNRLGEEAYVFTAGVNPELNTPTLTEDVVRRHQQADTGGCAQQGDEQQRGQAIAR